MPKIKRGHHAGTYEILGIDNVNHETLSFAVRNAAAVEPRQYKLKVADTEAAHQMLDAMVASIALAASADGDSRWTSTSTIDSALWYGTVVLRELTATGVTSFGDPRVDVPLLRTLYRPLSSSLRSAACWLLARVVKKHHPNGAAIAYALKNTRFAVEPTDPHTYDIDVAAAIEKTARRIWTGAYAAQRDLIAGLGFDVAGRDWLRIPAADIITCAKAKHPGDASCAEEPPVTADASALVAWALAHPERFGFRPNGRTAAVRGRQLQDIGAALYPDNTTLAAALIVHSLAEHAGYNLSVLLEKSTDSLTLIGSDEALERSVKPRASLEDNRATRLDSIFTSGGVVQTLAGLTRFSREHRRTHLEAEHDVAAHPVIERLYVEHVPDPAKARVLYADRMVKAWRGATFTKAWEHEAGTMERPPLRMGSLRLEAQRRLMGLGITADVHGHSESTKTHYLAHVLPDHAFNEHAIAAQDAFHDQAVTAFQIVAHATEGVAAELAAVDQAEVMDVEIGLCTNNGNAPDTDRRCHLGIVACFTCPNGYRTVDHVPGLLAAVEVATMIENNDPDEFENGQASDLNFYAQACLDAFPGLVVSNIRRTTDLTPHILTVTGMYMEMRHA